MRSAGLSLANLGVNLHRLFRRAHRQVMLAEFVHHFGVLGIRLDDRLERECGDLRVTGRFGGILEEVIRRRRWSGRSPAFSPRVPSPRADLSSSRSRPSSTRRRGRRGSSSSLSSRRFPLAKLSAGVQKSGHLFETPPGSARSRSRSFAARWRCSPFSHKARAFSERSFSVWMGIIRGSRGIKHPRARIDNGALRNCPHATPQKLNFSGGVRWLLPRIAKHPRKLRDRNLPVSLPRRRGWLMLDRGCRTTISLRS